MKKLILLLSYMALLIFCNIAQAYESGSVVFKNNGGEVLTPPSTEAVAFKIITQDQRDAATKEIAPGEMTFFHKNAINPSLTKTFTLQCKPKGAGSFKACKSSKTVKYDASTIIYIFGWSKANDCDCAKGE